MLWTEKHNLMAGKQGCISWIHFARVWLLICCWIFTISDMNSWRPCYDVLTFFLQPICAYGQEIQVSRHLSSMWVATWIMSKKGINILSKGIGILSSIVDVGIHFVNSFVKIKSNDTHYFWIMSLMNRLEKDFEVTEKWILLFCWKKKPIKIGKRRKNSL